MPQETFLIDAPAGWARVALVEGDRLKELLVEKRGDRTLVGNVYKGRVTRVLPGMQSAFVDVGLEKNAFLHVAQVVRAAIPEGGFKPIENVLHAGDTLVVQVVKDPMGVKGARLTTEVSLAGRLLVLVPSSGRVGVSQKIADAAERDRLRTLATRAAGDSPAPGFIVRTSAEGASGEELAADAAYLEGLWKDVAERARVSAAPALLYEDLGLARRALRDLALEDVGEILVEGEEAAADLRDFAARFLPGASEKIRAAESGLFSRYGVEEGIRKALSPRVELSCGGYLVIEETEALVSVDVNTGAYVGRQDFAQTVLNANLEAARAIARELRLRSLGGIVVIDFIDMTDEKEREAVLRELKAALAEDRVRTHVCGFSELGLVEMTRKRVRDSLSKTLTLPCPICSGSGRTRG